MTQSPSDLVLNVLSKAWLEKAVPVRSDSAENLKHPRGLTWLTRPYLTTCYFFYETLPKICCLLIRATSFEETEGQGYKYNF